MEWLRDTLLSLVYLIFDVLGSLLVTFIDFIKYGLYKFLISLLDIISYLLNGAFSLLKPLDLSGYINGFGEDAVNVLSYVGFPQALSMILVAITIRFTLQLIPFVRLGS